MAFFHRPRISIAMQLVVTVLGESRPDLIVEITRTIKDAKCTILESREPLYARAQVAMDTSGMPVEMAAEMLLTAIEAQKK